MPAGVAMPPEQIDIRVDYIPGVSGARASTNVFVFMWTIEFQFVEQILKVGLLDLRRSRQCRAASATGATRRPCGRYPPRL